MYYAQVLGTWYGRWRGTTGWSGLLTVFFRDYYLYIHFQNGSQLLHLGDGLPFTNLSVSILVASLWAVIFPSRHLLKWIKVSQGYRAYKTGKLGSKADVKQDTEIMNKEVNSKTWWKSTGSMVTAMPFGQRTKAIVVLRPCLLWWWA